MSGLTSGFTMEELCNAMKELHRIQEKQEAQLRQRSKVAGMEIRTENQWQLYCAGAPKDMVAADIVNAEAYNLLTTRELKYYSNE